MNLTNLGPYLLLSLAPAAVWLWWIRRQDVYDPEPVWLMVLSCFGGMAVAFPAVLLERIITAAVLSPDGSWWYVPDGNSLRETLVYSFLVVAVTEEYLKYAVVRFGAYRTPDFDEPMDGIVYMCSAAIGFAAAENALYMRGFGAWVLIVRMLLSTFLHIVCSACVGYHLGVARFRPKKALYLLERGFLLAVGFHGAYDFLTIYVPTAGFLSLFVLLLGLYWVRGWFLADIENALSESPFHPRRSLLPHREERRRRPRETA